MTLTDRGNESERDKHTLFDLTDFVQPQERETLYSLWLGCEVKCPTQGCFRVCVCVCECVWKGSNPMSMHYTA